MVYNNNKFTGRVSAETQLAMRIELSSLTSLHYEYYTQCDIYIVIYTVRHKNGDTFIGPERRVPKTYSSCSCWNQFSKNPQAFLNTLRSATKLCIDILAHIPYRSTVSDFKTNFYRAIHVVQARYCYRMSSVRPSVCPSVTLTYRGHRFD